MTDNSGHILMKVLPEVYAETQNQVSKWGVRDHSHAEWTLIASEEFGEVCKAALERKSLRAELVQLAAVIVSWVDNIDRKRD